MIWMLNPRLTTYVRLHNEFLALNPTCAQSIASLSIISISAIVVWIVEKFGLSACAMQSEEVDCAEKQTLKYGASQ